jgi:anti-anti-sigma regulatory factor
MVPSNPAPLLNRKEAHMFITITQRQSFIAICALIGTGALIYGALSAFAGEWTQVIVSLISLLITALLLAAYLRGWEQARHALVIVFVLLNVFGVIDVETVYRPNLLVPPALALVLLSPPWVIGTAITSVLLMGVRTGWSGPYLDVLNLLVYAIVVGLMLLARAILSTTAQQAEAARQQAEEARMRAESLVESLAEANAAQQTQLEEQRRLLALVATLETPAIALADGVLFAPIVGYVDSRRASALMQRLLEAAHSERVHHVIIDISGVTTVDSMVAKAIVDTAQALKLLGCDVTLSGISSKVALTLTQQGIAISDVATVRSPQEALQRISAGG